MERYVIRGGREGYDRLQLLHSARWADTSDLLGRIGVSRGSRCIDIGCGGGEVTFEIARLVGPDGYVLGIDMDHDERPNLDRRESAHLSGLGTPTLGLSALHTK